MATGPKARTMPEPDHHFSELLQRHGNELRLHCYRLLGSSHDSDDMLQETLARAWRAKATLQHAENGRAWLYRIATNVCLDELGRRKKRLLASEAGPAAVEPNPVIGPGDRETCLEPCPDMWLEGVPGDPGARYEQREAVALAFVAALQHLTPTQRATLLLRDVVGFSAEETSKTLELGLEATNSALFRARAAVESKIAGKEPAAFASASLRDVDSLLERYLRAWNEFDLDAFVALLHDEVVTTMPPAPTWIARRPANVAFYRPMFAAQRRSSLRAVPIAANGERAFAFYRSTSPEEPFRLRAIHLVAVRDTRIARIDHFMLPELHRVFALPETLEGAAPAATDATPCVEIAQRILGTRGE